MHRVLIRCGTCGKDSYINKLEIINASFFACLSCHRSDIIKGSIIDLTDKFSAIEPSAEWRKKMRDVLKTMSDSELQLYVDKCSTLDREKIGLTLCFIEAIMEQGRREARWPKEDLGSKS